MSAPRLLAPTTISGGVPTAGAGTLNTIALWTPDGNTLGNSLLTQSGNIVTNASGAIRAAGTTQTSPAFTRHDTTTSGIYFPATNEIGFTISSQHAMFISSGRNVGIGTTSPSYKLDVVSAEVRIGASAPGANTFLYLGNGVTSAGPYGVGALQFSGQAHTAVFANSGYGAARASLGMVSGGVYTPALSADPSGNVGIGTASPGNLLTLSRGNGSGFNLQYDAAGNARTGLFLATRGSSSAIIGGGSEWADATTTARSTAATAILQNAGVIQFFTDTGLTSGNTFTPTERARIDSAGRLLVGTTGTPSSAAIRVVVAGASGGQQWHSQGLGGCAVVASVNTAQWYVYPGANVGSEGYLSSVKLTETGLDVTTAHSTPGIKLPATPGNADTQTLDAYRENTFTPTIQGGTTAGVGTYTSQIGTFTIIGRCLFFNVEIAWSAHTGTGVVQLAGLPVAAAQLATFGLDSNYAAAGYLRMSAGNTYAQINTINVPATGNYRVSGCYFIV